MNKIHILCKWASIILITMISTFFFVQITNTAVPEGHDFTVVAADADYAPGELLVRFAPKAKGIQRSAEEKYQILSSLGGGTVERNYTIVPGLTLVKLPTGLTVKDALKTFNKTDGILHAEPNYRVKAFSAIFPNDPYGPKAAPDGGKQWHLNNIGQDPPGGTSGADIDAPEGWDIHTGSSEIIVGSNYDPQPSWGLTDIEAT